MDSPDSGQLQDFLLDMDFDEFIPVDNFFSSYVRALDDGCYTGTHTSCPSQSCGRARPSLDTQAKPARPLVQGLEEMCLC
jgi:hypothetical protein